ncbi:tryptophan-rich sensory protein [Dictyobacter kobayashii]|uniref:Tryptophan-rich sensory protein n=1 Tax=Dictyobacter kobayashii TaxID=2014872 RepID=A0A402AJQ3_9CHLR|nr:tryptophan-rich sensory protein [Dictyobacter kobayashii]GCE19303.1 hypothetical protein KDK_31030 [Dictyobacter kobayashii]
MTKDITRQIINVVVTIATVLLNVFSSNVFGRSVGEVSRQYPVSITPANYAFAIWGIIYLGLIAFAIYQALPAQRTNPRLRRIGYWYALSCIANVGWEYVWLNERINLSLLLMAILLLSLLVIYIRTNINKESASPLESWCLNAPFGLYLGWITVASIVNTAVVLANLGWNGAGISPIAWTAILLVIGTAVAVYVGLTCVDIAFLAVIVWAYIAILVKNSGTPAITITAAIMVIIILATILTIALRRKSLLRWAGAPVYS